MMLCVCKTGLPAPSEEKVTIKLIGKDYRRVREQELQDDVRNTRKKKFNLPNSQILPETELNEDYR